MNLITLYQTYMTLNKDYMKFIENLVENDVEGNNEVIRQKLTKAKMELENLMNQSEQIKIEEENQDNLKDMRYLLTDTLFLAIDLVTMYEYEELGRFKMRVINYVNKQKHVEMFGGMNDGNCRVGF